MTVVEYGHVPQGAVVLLVRRRAGIKAKLSMCAAAAYYSDRVSNLPAKIRYVSVRACVNDRSHSWYNKSSLRVYSYKNLTKIHHRLVITFAPAYASLFIGSIRSHSLELDHDNCFHGCIHLLLFARIFYCWDSMVYEFTAIRGHFVPQKLQGVPCDSV